MDTSFHNEVIREQRNSVNNEQTVYFDEALSRLGFGKFNYIIIFLSGIIITATSFETLGISFVFPVAECDLRLTTQHKGVLSGVTSIGIITSSHFWGFLADTKGRKNVIVPTLILSFISSVFSSLATSYGMLVLFRFFSGFFIAGSSATIYAYLGEFHSSKNRSKVLMAASFIYGIACNYMPILAFLILNRTFHLHIPFINIDYKPWRLYLFLCGLPSFVCAIALLFIPESPKFTFSKGDEEQTLIILERIHAINNSNSKDQSSLNIIKVVEDKEFLENYSREITNISENPFVMFWKTTCLLFSGNNLRKAIIICLMQCGLYGSCHGLYMFFPEIVDKIATYSNHFPSGRSTICKVLRVEDQMATNITTYSVALKQVELCSEKFELSTFGHSLAMEILYTIGFLIITFIINRTSKLSILVVILFGCGISGFATLFVQIPLLSIYLYVIFMLTFLAVNVVNAITVDLFPTNLRGMAINVAMMFGRIGSVLGTNIVGFTLDQHCASTFTVSAAMMCMCGILSFFIPKIR